MLRTLCGLALAAGAAADAVAVSAAGEQTNPHEAAGDTTTECYTWAADGQCKDNPGFMLTSCKYSCWEWYAHRRRTFPDAPIDKQFDCHSWAKSGECKKNEPYMRTECPESCKDRFEEEPPPPPPSPPRKKKKKKRKRKAKADDSSDE